MGICITSPICFIPEKLSLENFTCKIGLYVFQKASFWSFPLTIPTCAIELAYELSRLFWWDGTILKLINNHQSEAIRLF